ncbi:hypothetical protein UIA24_15885 [Pseudomonas sp. AL 58]|uniref:hypothetical protein n=1 Tax=Pseudomonas sp. AL 58 TaxID=3104275 RepID=UPI002EA18EDD|nr:hypothetical protein [Pseudomonas sp. AL 58]
MDVAIPPHLLSNTEALAALEKAAALWTQQGNALPDIVPLLATAFDDELKRQYPQLELDPRNTWVKTFSLTDNPEHCTLQTNKTLEQVMRERLVGAATVYDEGLSGIYADGREDDQPGTRMAGTRGLEGAIDTLTLKLGYLYRDAVTAYWNAATAEHTSRDQQLADALSQALHLDAARRLSKDEQALLSSALSTPADSRRALFAYSLSLLFEGAEAAHLAGAFILRRQPVADASQADAVPTLLYLPGDGLSSHGSLGELFDALLPRREQWSGLLSLSHQRALDGQRRIEWQCREIVGHLLTDVVQAQLKCQQADIIDILQTRRTTFASYQVLFEGLAAATQRIIVNGPPGMAVVWHAEHAAYEAYRQLPYWMKLCSTEERQRYVDKLQAYQDAQEDLCQALGKAESPEQFARVTVALRLREALGVDLDPDQLWVTTERRLPVTREVYTEQASLSSLALYGLHPGDEAQASDFITGSTLQYQGLPVEQVFEGLTPATLAPVLAPLQLRSTFSQQWREAITPGVLQRMQVVMSLRLQASLCAAGFQGILAEDQVQAVGVLHTPFVEQTALRATAYLLKINGAELADVMVFCLTQADGEAAGLLLYAPDVPGREPWLKVLDERRLLHEIVGWTAVPALRDYLLARVPQAARNALDNVLSALAQKPAAEADFLTLSPQVDYPTALQRLVALDVELTQARFDAHTPAWYRDAPLAERQQLHALETQVAAASQRFTEQSLLQVPDFESFVKAQATEKINQLLGTPAGTVDPDTIIITSPRERATFTHLLRNGYDDSISLTQATLDTSATFEGPEGVDLSPLRPENVSGAIRGQWVADRYIQVLRDTLLNPEHEGYATRRQASVTLTQLQMSVAALRSKLMGQITGEQYAWLSQTLSSFQREDAPTRLAHPVHLLNFNLEAVFNTAEYPWLAYLGHLSWMNEHLGTVETVEGNYVMLAPENTGQPALLYTPDAPDGLAFREFQSFEASLAHAGMGDYYKDRMRHKLGRWMSYRLHAVRRGAAAGPVLSSAPIMSLQKAFHDQRIERKMTDVADLELGRADMISRITWTGVELVATAVTLPFPPASFAVGAFFALKESASAIKALADGDRAKAVQHALSSAFNTLGALGDMKHGFKGLGKLWKMLPHASDVSTTRIALAGNDALHGVAPPLSNRVIDRSFALKQRPKDLTLRTDGDFNGVYEGEVGADGFPHYYITDTRGRYYQVQYKGGVALEPWRIVETRRRGYGPAVRRNILGHWEVSFDVGLRGGAPQTPAEVIQQGLQTVTREDVQVLANQLGLPSQWTLEAILEVFRRFTLDEAVQVLRRFSLPADDPDLARLLADQFVQHKRFPEWALQFLPGRTPDPAWKMIQRAEPGQSQAAAEAFLRRFNFTEGERAAKEWALALHFESRGYLPFWSIEHLPPATGATVPVIAPLHGVSRVQQMFDWRSWSTPVDGPLIETASNSGIFVSAQNTARRVIQVDNAYYEVLDDGVELVADCAVLKPPPSLDGVLPRYHRMQRVNGVWSLGSGLRVDHMMYTIKRRFPQLTDQSTKQFSRRLMESASINGKLTAAGVLKLDLLLGVLDNPLTKNGASVVDPFGWLRGRPEVAAGAGFSLHSETARFTAVEFVVSEEQFARAPLHAVVRDVLTANYYTVGQVFSDQAFGPGQLLVRCNGSDRLYLVIVRPTHASHVYPLSSSTLKRLMTSMDAETRQALRQARAAKELVVLMAGKRVSASGRDEGLVFIRPQFA